MVPVHTVQVHVHCSPARSTRSVPPTFCTYREMSAALLRKGVWCAVMAAPSVPPRVCPACPGNGHARRRGTAAPRHARLSIARAGGRRPGQPREAGMGGARGPRGSVEGGGAGLLFNKNNGSEVYNRQVYGTAGRRITAAGHVRRGI